MRRAPLVGRVLLASMLALWACRPDPYALALAMIEPGEPVELGGGRTLTVESKDGDTLYGVRIEGPAETCKGTMEVEAPEARLERPSPGDGGGDGDDPLAGAPRLVFERPVAVERCGELTSVTRHERLIVNLDAMR